MTIPPAVFVLWRGKWADQNTGEMIGVFSSVEKAIAAHGANASLWRRGFSRDSLYLPEDAITGYIKRVEVDAGGGAV